MPRSLRGTASIEQAFHEILLGEDAREALGPLRARTFSDLGMLTDDAGVEVTLADGRKLQVTIKEA